MEATLKAKMVATAEHYMVGKTLSIKEYKCGEQDALFIKREGPNGDYAVTVTHEKDADYVWLSNHSGKTERSSILLSNPFRPVVL